MSRTEEQVALEQVFANAASMDPTERWKAWLKGGGDHHPLASLPRTETGGAPPPYYCPECWTAFTYTGTVLNRPQPVD